MAAVRWLHELDLSHFGAVGLLWQRRCSSSFSTLYSGASAVLTRRRVFREAGPSGGGQGAQRPILASHSRGMERELVQTLQPRGEDDEGVRMDHSAETNTHRSPWAGATAHRTTRNATPAPLHSSWEQIRSTYLQHRDYIQT